MIDREDALTELVAIAEHATTRVCPVVITGPTGIGKSAVAETFLAGLDETWAVVELFCDPRRSVTPLHPFRPVLPELFAAAAEPSARAVVAALRERWGTANPVLLVDDVDAADPSTRQLLDEFPEHLASGLVAAHEQVTVADRARRRRSSPTSPSGRSTGPHRARSPRRSPASGSSASTCSTRSPIAPAVCRCTSSRSPAPCWTSRTVRRTCRASLYDSLMSVLDRLGPARGLAQRLSVLGPSFDDADLDLVTAGADPAEVRAHLAAIVDAGVLRVDDGNYRFTNALIADAAYESLLNADRAALHAAIAAAMPASAVQVAPERLAFHLAAAGRPFEAAVAYRRASATAIARNRPREAQDQARRALRLLDELGPDGQPDGGDTRRRVLTNLALATPGDEPRQRRDARRRRRGSPEWRRQRRHRQARPARRDGHQRPPRVRGDDRWRPMWPTHPWPPTEAAGDKVSAAFAHQFLGATLIWRGDVPAGSRELELAATVWEHQRSVPIAGARAIAAMWSMLGLAATFADRPDEAVRRLARSRDVVPDGDGYAWCLVAATGSMVDQLGGRTAAVREAVEPVWSLAVDLGTEFWSNWTQALLGWAVAAEDAATGLALIAETVDESPTRQTMPYFLYLLGSRLCEHGRLTDGLTRLDDGITFAEETGELLWSPLIQLTKATMARRPGRPGRRHGGRWAGRRRGTGERSRPDLPVAQSVAARAVMTGVRRLGGSIPPVLPPRRRLRDHPPGRCPCRTSPGVPR